MAKRALPDLSRFGRLAEYNRKRHFAVTPEPPGRSVERAADRPREFVVQKHRASQLHYDFRLEHRGVMLSWAVPKGPSLDPAVKRLAMETEPHPLDYNQFEGVIPEGEYGGGTVMIWDRGVWAPVADNKLGDDADVDRQLAKGELKFVLLGKKLAGSWTLVRTGTSTSPPTTSPWPIRARWSRGARWRPSRAWPAPASASSLEPPEPIPRRRRLAPPRRRAVQLLAPARARRDAPPAPDDRSAVRGTSTGHGTTHR